MRQAAIRRAGLAGVICLKLRMLSQSSDQVCSNLRSDERRREAHALLAAQAMDGLPCRPQRARHAVRQRLREYGDGNERCHRVVLTSLLSTLLEIIDCANCWS